MRQGSGYIPIETNAPFRGLASALPSTRLDPAFSPSLINTTIREGVVRRRFGYTKIGQTLQGVVLGFEEFAAIGETPVLVVFTSKRQYYYDVPNDNFVDISKRDVSTFAIDAVDTGTKVFEVVGDQTSTFTTGRRFGVIGSTGNDGYYTVASSTFAGPNTEITVDETIPDDTADGDIQIDTRYPIVGATTTPESFSVAGDHTSIFTADKIFSVNGSTDNDGSWTVVSSVFSSPNTIIAVAETVDPSVADGYITTIKELSTGESGSIDFDIMTDLDGRRLLMTDGIDRPRVWNGDTDTNFEDWLPLYPNFVTCKAIRVHVSHLLLGNVTTSIEEPQLIVWSDTGVFDDFVNGNSGAQVLHEFVHEIERMEKLGDRLVIYTDDAIANAIFVGLPAIFAFEVVIPEGTRLVSPRAVIPINVGQVYASEENFYLFDGTRGMRVVGDTVREDYKTRKDHARLHEVCTLNDYSKKTIFIAVPDLEGKSLVYTVEYDIFDLSRMIWSREKYNDVVRAFGFLTNISEVTWEDTPQEPVNSPWEDEIGPWGTEGEQVNFPVRVFGSDAGEVFRIAETTIDDNGVTVEMIYDTVDFTIPGSFHSSFGRWGEIEVEATGDEVEVYYSSDLGGSYTLAQTLTLNGSFRIYQVPIDVSSRTLRVRLRSIKDVSFRWIRVWVREGAPR